MKTYIAWAAFAVGTFAASMALAGGHHCHHCGCDCSCNKTCRLVKEIKKVPKITYTCECEDFCIPGPSKKCGCTCTSDCECGHKHCKPNWVPNCASVHTKKKLVKHEDFKEVCSYKWVVEDLCPRCAACQTASTPAQADAVAASHETPTAAQEPEMEPAQESALPPRAPRLAVNNLADSLKRKLQPLWNK